jgi:hypothetical protein
MRERIEAQPFSHFVPVTGKEFSGFACAGIGNHETDVEIVGDGGELLEKTVLGEIESDNSMLCPKLLTEVGTQFREQGFTPGHKNHVYSRGRHLAGKLPTDTRQ